VLRPAAGLVGLCLAAVLVPAVLVPTVLVPTVLSISHGPSGSRSHPRSTPAPTAGAAGPMVLSTGPLRVGVTLAQRAADPWESPPAVARARALLASQPVYQAQNLMGWGVGNPEPSPGVYDWSGLDRRMAQITATGGTSVITLAGAPDWMAGHAPGETDWSRLGEAPTPAHYGAFADLAAAVARRYPSVHVFQVWNELDGFWDARTETWDTAAYTRLYNDVYRAIKAVDPLDRVGGPYVVMTSYAQRGAAPGAVIKGPWGAVDPRDTDALDYWFRHAVGADFVAVDADSAPTWGRPVTSAVAATAKFAAVDEWIRTRTGLPIWWSEFYVQPDGSRWSPAQQAAVLTVAMARMAASGASVALLWGPEADGQGAVLGYLWTSCERPDGGRATPLAASILAFDRRGSRQATILVNPGASTRRWSGTTPDVVLGPWQVVYR
jgi:hypothetical protein